MVFFDFFYNPDSTVLALKECDEPIHTNSYSWYEAIGNEVLLTLADDANIYKVLILCQTLLLFYFILTTFLKKILFILESRARGRGIGERENLRLSAECGTRRGVQCGA